MGQQVRLTLQYSLGNDALGQGLAKYSPQAKSSPAPALVNKVLSKHGQPIHSRLYCLQQLSGHTTVRGGGDRDCEAEETGCFTFSEVC